MSTVTSTIRIGPADHGRSQAVSLVLPGFTVRLLDLWPEVEDDHADSEAANGVS